MGASFATSLSNCQASEGFLGIVLSMGESPSESWLSGGFGVRLEIGSRTDGSIGVSGDCKWDAEVGNAC